jgi:hypothetical protein
MTVLQNCLIHPATLNPTYLDGAAQNVVEPKRHALGTGHSLLARVEMCLHAIADADGS